MSGEYDSLGPESGFPIMVDPLVEDAYRRAARYQDQLDTLPNVEQSTVQDMLEDLNEAWPYQNTKMKVFGTLKTQPIAVLKPEPALGDVISDDVQEDPRIKFFVRDQEFISNGFGAELLPWPEKIDEEDIGYRAIIKLSFWRPVTVFLSDTKSIEEPLLCDAAMNEVSFATQDESLAFSELQAREYFPDIIKQIDECITPNMTPVECLRALSAMDLRYPQYVTGREMLALQRHIDDVVAIQSETTPFLITVRDDTLVFDVAKPDQVMSCIPKENFAARLMAIKLYPRLDMVHDRKLATFEYQPGVFDVRLDMQLYGPRAENDSTPYQIRLRDLIRIKNFREAYFNSSRSKPATSD